MNQMFFHVKNVLILTNKYWHYCLYIQTSDQFIKGISYILFVFLLEININMFIHVSGYIMYVWCVFETFFNFFN